MADADATAPATHGRNAGLVAEVAMLLFISAGSFGLFSLWREGSVSPVSYLMVLSVPAGAALCLSILGASLPGLFAVGRIAFPLNFTMPILHGSLSLLIVELARSSFGILAPIRVADAFRWGDLRFLTLATVWQFLVLSVLSVLRSPGDKNAKAKPDAGD